MKFHNDVLLRYASIAPLALAFERTLECRIYQRLPFERPILDLGCGDGVFAKVLFDEPIDTGVDPDPRELACARRLGTYGELLPCAGDAVPKSDGSFRTIFSNSVLEHIRDLGPVLNEIHRLLAAGGHFYATVPSDRFERYAIGNRVLAATGLASLAAGYRRRYNRFWKHYHCYPLDTWKALARRAGFEVLEAFPYAPPRICTLNDLLVLSAFPAFVSKRMTGRWVWSPSIRRVMLGLVNGYVRRILDGAERADDGGLIFLRLRRAGSA